MQWRRGCKYSTAYSHSSLEVPSRGGNITILMTMLFSHMCRVDINHRSDPYPSGTKLSEFISLVEKHVGKKANIKLLPEQPGDVPFTNADVSKAKRLLGYESKVTMEEGIKRTVAWYK
eukprot:scaffold2225_cov198-Alexandrium_tamarense.AAC.7